MCIRDRCEEAISLSAKALTSPGQKLQEKVFPLTVEIDRMEREIESSCLRILLHQQPVAGDLRVVSATLKMVSDLERIGDQAGDIAELAPYIVDSGIPHTLHLGDMARAAVGMVTDSIDAVSYTHLDVYKRQSERPVPTTLAPAAIASSGKISGVGFAQAKIIGSFAID